MAPLENNTQIPSPTIPCPTVSLLCPISSSSAFDDNSNDKSEEEEDDDDEGEENDANSVNTLMKNQKAISVTMSDTQQQAPPNLKNYQGTSTKSETNPVDINMEANQDAIFEGEIEVITKEAFLKKYNCKVKEAIDLLCVDEEKVISGQPLTLDSSIKIGNTALLHKRKRPKNKNILKNKKPFIAAPETSSGADSNIITAENSGTIPESLSNPINSPEFQAPQSLVETQIPSQGDNLSIPENLTVQPQTSRSNILNTGNFSDLAINTNVITEVQLPVPVSCPSQFFLQHEDVLSATLGNIYHSKSSSRKITLGSILALAKHRNSRIEGVDLPNYLPSGIKIKSNYGTSISK
ncbi:hypothetical protein BY996DRAFT_8554445 [Phakopsora pachyrhizi]|nr:hypothetical protein BY996DRAFT_8554445 [Phakopsora pachyrhizi]